MFKRLAELRPLLDSVPDYVQNWGDALAATGSVAANFTKWKILGKFVDPNYPPYPTTYQGELDRLKSWTTDRLRWMLSLDSIKPLLSYAGTPAIFCLKQEGNYSIDPLQATDNYTITSIKYEITGATIRSGSGTDASGKFNAGASTITWTVKDQSDNVSTYQLPVQVNAAVAVMIPDVKVLSSGVEMNTVYNGYAPAASITLTATPLAGTAPYSYSWSTGATGASISVSPQATTTYTVNMTDAKGCVSQADKLINYVNADASSYKKPDLVYMCHKGKTKTEKTKDVYKKLREGDKLGKCANCRADRPAPDKPVLVEKENPGLKVQVSPNPSSSYFTLVLSGNNTKPITLLVMDIAGHVVEKRTVAGGTLQVGSNYIPGVYIAEIVQEKTRKSFKLVKSSQ